MHYALSWVLFFLMQTCSMSPAPSTSLNLGNCHSNHRSLKTVLTDTWKKHRKLNKKLQLQIRNLFFLFIILVHGKLANSRKQIICLEKTEKQCNPSKGMLLKSNLCLRILLKQSILKQFQATLESISWPGLYLGVQHIP